MTNDDLAAQLATIEQHAPKLREAGVRSLKLGDLELELAPADPPDIVFGDDDDNDQADGAKPSPPPLDDPTTFNRSSVPSRRRELMGQSDGKRRG